jgi:hypothetical protein
MIPNKIQSREYSKDSGVDDISYNSNGNPNLLGVNRNDNGSWLGAYVGAPVDGWGRDGGFAVSLPQFSSFLS